jgi:addiction module antidote protein HigA
MDAIEKAAFHPGEYLKEELETRGWTQKELAEMIGRPQRLINRIIAGKAGITAQTAQQLAAAFGTSAALWMNLQSQYDRAKIGGIQHGGV